MNSENLIYYIYRCEICGTTLCRPRLNINHVNLASTDHSCEKAELIKTSELQTVVPFITLVVASDKPMIADFTLDGDMKYTDKNGNKHNHW